MRSGSPFNAVIVYILIGIVSIFMIIPFIWMTSVSLKPSGEYLNIHLGLFLHLQLSKTIECMGSCQFQPLLYKYNSFCSGWNTLTVSLCSLGGYVFAKLRFPGKNILFMVVLFTMMLPFLGSHPVISHYKNFPL